MPLLIVLFALIVPRITLAVLWLFTDRIGAVFSTLLWPILGFIFLPATTVCYVVAARGDGSIAGMGLLLVLLGAVIDLAPPISFRRRD